MKFRWETEFKETEIGELPKDWEVRKLGVFNIKYGRGLPKNQRKIGTVPVVGSSGIVGYHSEALAKAPGIVIGRKGNVGSVYFLKEDFYPIDTVFYIENLLEIEEAKYIFYIISKYDFDQIMSDSAVPGLNINLLKQVKIPYPPPEEQTRIATVLSWFDDLIENKKKQNEILEKMAMAIFKSWFIDFEPFQDEEFVYSEELGMEIPEGWEVKPIKEIGTVNGGTTPSTKRKEYWNGEIPWITPKDVSDAGNPVYMFHGERNITQKAVYDEHVPIFPKGTILLTSRAPIGYVSIAGNDLATNQGFKNIAPNKRHVTTEYLYCYITTITPYLREIAGGSTFPEINAATLENVQILVPPFNIVQSFTKIVEPLFQKILLNQKQILTLKKIRDALLPQLVFGRLRIEKL